VIRPTEGRAYHLLEAMKTGRLLKFQRPGGEVHAYLYADGAGVRAALYLMEPGRDRTPVREITGSSDERVEAEVRAWVETHYPRPSRP
jgi:hypothetical protein